MGTDCLNWGEFDVTAHDQWYYWDDWIAPAPLTLASTSVLARAAGRSVPLALLEARRVNKAQFSFSYHVWK